MPQIKDFDMKLAKEFGQIAQAVISRPINILKRTEKANDKVDFSSGRYFQEIAIDIEHISEDISSKNFDSMETLENMFVPILERIAELTVRLEIEQEQFKQIRLHTQDGDLACICADHEMKIKELLSSPSK